MSLLELSCSQISRIASHYPNSFFGNDAFPFSNASSNSCLKIKRNRLVCNASGEQSHGKDPLLLRVARGEEAERTPVWLMRQAGRYMAEFRKFSDHYPFRVRSETPEIAIELSLQPWRAFQTDGVIFFSDILTILPALGVEFDMVKGKGPVIENPLRSFEDVNAMKLLDDPTQSLPFTGEILSFLRKEISKTDTALLGFVGSPFTLAAYAIEGKADKNLMITKKIMFNEPELMHRILNNLEEALFVYCCYQIESGAQLMQIFDSWAHHLSPTQFAEFSLPYAQRLTLKLKKKYQNVPVIFHANGGTGKHHIIKHNNNNNNHGDEDNVNSDGTVFADVIGIDWNTDIREARQTYGQNVVLQGNVDPMILFANEEKIRSSVNECILHSGNRKHILNVGHGVIQGTPEENVALFVQVARESGLLKKNQKMKENLVLNV